MKAVVALLVVLVIAVGWTERSRLPFIGTQQYGSTAGASAALVRVSDQGLLGGPSGQPPAAGASCVATSRPAGLRENPMLVSEGVGFSFYDCRLRLADGTSQRFCLAAGGGGGQPTQYTAAGRGPCAAIRR